MNECISSEYRELNRSFRVLLTPSIDQKVDRPEFYPALSWDRDHNMLHEENKDHHFTLVKDGEGMITAA